MKNILFVLALIYFLNPAFSYAQEPESFFPHGVGDLWNYTYSDGRSEQSSISRDSIGPDGSHNLFYGEAGIPEFRIDTAFNVYEWPVDSFLNTLLYKLGANTGDIWENPERDLRWVWVAKIETAYVFSELTIIKVFRYAFGPPDSADSPAFAEHWLASGFGIVYRTGEGGYDYLEGCVIAGDTFGYVTSVNDLKNALPSVFQLKQNYPNPFNPLTTIEFDLPEESETSLYVYDILGEQIGLLYKGIMTGGNHKIKWNAGGLPSGIYFCQLRVNGNNKTIKMLLTK